MKKTLKSYETTLRRMIEARTGAPFDEFLAPQVAAAAMCWQTTEKMHREVMDGPMSSIETGSMGQQKVVVNPMLAAYEKMHRTLLLHFEALGLNFRATPSKITEPTNRSTTDGQDPMARFLAAAGDKGFQ